MNTILNDWLFSNLEEIIDCEYSASTDDDAEAWNRMVSDED